MTATEDRAINRLSSPSESHFSRVGAVAAFAGLVVYVTSAVLHPGIPPHETKEAFTHYAAQPAWALIHLGELLGILLMSVAALALTWRLRRGAAGVWAILAAAAMLLCASVYAIFAAVDGVAIGVMSRRWVEAAGERQELLFETAFAVRQIEAGLFSLQWFMFGMAAGVFAVAFVLSADGVVARGWRRVMAGLSALASIGTLAFAIVQAEAGFTERSMAFQIGLYAGVLWVIAVGVFLYRHPAQVHAGPGDAR